MSYSQWRNIHSQVNLFISSTAHFQHQIYENKQSRIVYVPY